MPPASTTKDKTSAGDPIPPKCALIEVHVGELKQLFNAIDPAPFRDRDLDPKAEEFIVGWAKDLPRDAQLALLIDLDRQAGLPDEAAVLRGAIHEFFCLGRPCHREVSGRAPSSSRTFAIRQVKSLSNKIRRLLGCFASFAARLLQ